MKQDKFLRKCGPFEVHSISQDMRGVRLEIYPAFPQYNLTTKQQDDKYTDESWQKDPRWPIHRYKGEGGGPSIFTAMALAKTLEEFLNQPYTEEEIQQWKATLDEALRKVRERDRKAMDKAFKKLEKR